MPGHMRPAVRDAVNVSFSLIPRKLFLHSKMVREVLERGVRIGFSLLLFFKISSNIKQVIAYTGYYK